jgi:hypothetical protein
MKNPQSDIPEPQNERKQRLAEALRANLQSRKARTRASASKIPETTVVNENKDA